MNEITSTAITTNNFPQELSDEALASAIRLIYTWGLNDPSSFELGAVLVQERIRRHALVCQDLECGFSPYI